MQLLLFLTKAAFISLSGVLAPGPVTAATLAAAGRSRHAGAMIALGHGLVELPLMIVIVRSMKALYRQGSDQVGPVLLHQSVRIGISLAGGLLLALMALRMFRDAAHSAANPAKASRRGPLITGVLLTAGNPYFLLWWTTIGLALATQAVELGPWAFVLFAVVHWCCDLLWLELLSLAGHAGAQIWSSRTQKIILQVCAVALLFFGGTFVADAVRQLMNR